MLREKNFKKSLIQKINYPIIAKYYQAHGYNSSAKLTHEKRPFTQYEYRHWRYCDFFHVYLLLPNLHITNVFSF